MIGVDKIDDIRRLGRRGASVASIARDTGVSEPTVRKYLRECDLSERPPAVGRAPESPLLEPFAELVDSWLLEDRRCWFKQRHTAKRVFDRLVSERGFEGSYTTVQRYVRRRREELAAEADDNVNVKIDDRATVSPPPARPRRRLPRYRTFVVLVGPLLPNPPSSCRSGRPSACTTCPLS